MTSLTRITIVAVLALLVSGCASTLPPTNALENADLNLTIPTDWTRDAGAEGPVTGAWWRSFNDPRLNATVANVLKGNRDLKAAAWRVEQAAAAARITGADLYPGVGAGYRWSRTRQNFIGLPIPGGGGVLSNTSTSQGLSLNVSWEVDVWGKVRKRRLASIADFEAAQFDTEAAAESLAAQAVKVYFTLQGLEAQVALSQENLESLRTTAEWIRSRYELGLRSSLDLRLAMRSVAEAEAILQAQLDGLQASRRQLEYLQGAYPAGEASAGSGPLPQLLPVPVGLPSELVLRRYDLQAAERRLAASYARVDEARANLYPSISLTASGGTSSEELEDLLDWDFRIWNIVADLVQPIFQGGRIRAGIAAQQAESKAALESYAGAILLAFTEVETTLHRETFLREQELAIERAVTQISAARQLAEDQYRLGLTDYLVVQDAQRGEFAARQSVLDIRTSRLTNRVDLLLALGGGFDEGDAVAGAVPRSGLDAVREDGETDAPATDAEQE